MKKYSTKKILFMVLTFNLCTFLNFQISAHVISIQLGQKPFLKNNAHNAEIFEKYLSQSIKSPLSNYVLVAEAGVKNSFKLNMTKKEIGKYTTFDLSLDFDIKKLPQKPKESYQFPNNNSNIISFPAHLEVRDFPLLKLASKEVCLKYKKSFLLSKEDYGFHEKKVYPYVSGQFNESDFSRFRKEAPLLDYQYTVYFSGVLRSKKIKYHCHGKQLLISFKIEQYFGLFFFR